MTKVAILFAENCGIYERIPNVDIWDKYRDAKLYSGPYPIVAHPPCQLWTHLAEVNYKRYGGEHNQPGNDNGCFKFAVDCLHRYGGILEHPALSRAWRQFNLIQPTIRYGWEHVREREWVCEVWQSAYGHKARKRTWLCYVGNTAPMSLDFSYKPGTHQVGWFDRTKPTLSKREASATPYDFARVLVTLAIHSTTYSTE